MKLPFAKKLFPVLLAVLFIAAVFVVPAFAQEPNPPAADPAAFDFGVISQALQTLLTAILVPGAAFLARWLFAKADYEKMKLSSEQQYAFDLFLKTCVYAAEQINLRGMVKSKFDYVIALAEAWLKQRNIAMDIAEIHARIESVVAQELNKPKLAGSKSE